MPNFRTLLPGFVKQMQCNALKIKTAAKQREYPKNQATQKNTCQIFQPQKILPSAPPLEIRGTSTSRAVKLEFPIGWIKK